MRPSHDPGVAMKPKTQPGRDGLRQTADQHAALTQQRRQRWFVTDGSVDIILDDQQIVPTRQLRDRLAPLAVHADARGILQAGRQHRDPRTGGPSLAIELLGHDAVLIERHTIQRQAQLTRSGLDAGRGQRLDQHRFARCAQPSMAANTPCCAPAQSRICPGGSSSPRRCNQRLTATRPRCSAEAEGSLQQRKL